MFLLDLLDGLVPIAAYILAALGLLWIGQACGVKYPWLSFIPIGSDYALGLVAEKSASRGTHECKPYRKILLGLSIATAVLGMIALTALVVCVLGVVADLNLDWAMILDDPDYLTNWLESLLEDTAALDEVTEAFMSNIVPLAILLTVGLALAVVSVIYLVFYFIALFHIYNLYDPKNAKLYTVLSVLGHMVIPYVGALVAPCLLVVLSRTKKPQFDDEDNEDDTEIGSDPSNTRPSEPWTNL